MTATVSPASPDPFTVTLAATPVDPAAPEDFVLEGTLLSFAADATESTGEVRVTAVDNDEDAPDRTVTVSGTVSLETVTAPLPVTLTITDDDEGTPPVERGVDRLCPASRGHPTSSRPSSPSARATRPAARSP